jgi:hypothetical protein
MTTYRRYQASFPFNARDSSELTIKPGQTLLVSKNAKGEWPSQEKWMHGRNEETDMEGDFPGNFVEFMEEFTEQPPETNHEEKVLPPLPPLPSKPPPPSSRGGIQVFPMISPTPSPSSITSSPHSATSPTHHRSTGYSSPSQSSLGGGGSSASPARSTDDDDAPPPPPRLGGRRVLSGSQLPAINQQAEVVENHYSLAQDETFASPPPPVASRGPPIPKPRGRKLSEVPQHNWVAVSYQIPVECNACELVSYQISDYVMYACLWRW